MKYKKGDVFLCTFSRSTFFTQGRLYTMGSDEEILIDDGTPLDLEVVLEFSNLIKLIPATELNKALA